jgi:hypothetical protein
VPLYQDGLYEVGDLRIYNNADKKVRGGSEPREPVTTSDEMIEVSADVDAVLIGVKRRPDKKVLAAVQKRFRRFETVEDVEVHLLRPDEADAEAADEGDAASSKAERPREEDEELEDQGGVD